MTPSRLSVLAMGVAGVALGAAVGAGLMSRYGTPARQTDSPVVAGTPLVSVLGDELRMLTYTHDALTVTAQRTKPADRMAVQITFADGRQAVHCLAAADLGGLMPWVTTITVKRPLAADRFKALYPARLGTLEWRDAVVTEPSPPLSFWTTSSRGAVAAAQGASAWEVDTSVEVFDRLASLCGPITKP